MTGLLISVFIFHRNNLPQHSLDQATPSSSLHNQIFSFSWPLSKRRKLEVTNLSCRSLFHF